MRLSFCRTLRKSGGSRARTDFANASHELKTPIAALRLYRYPDGGQVDAPDTRRTFSRSAAQVSRLQALSLTYCSYLALNLGMRTALLRLTSLSCCEQCSPTNCRTPISPISRQTALPDEFVKHAEKTNRLAVFHHPDDNSLTPSGFFV